MTREEAIQVLSMVEAHGTLVIQAKEMAIKALKQEPCEDCISRQAVLNTLENMDRALDEDRTVENYKELLRECYKVLPPVNPQKPICPSAGVDCEDCLAYEKKPNINAVLDKIRAEIDDLGEGISSYHNDRPWVFKDEVLQIIDKYAEEGKS